MIPPSILRLRLNSLNLWLPLFLLWPLLLLAAPFVLLAAVVLLRPLRLTAASWRLLCALRGLEVDVQQPGQLVQLKFI